MACPRVERADLRVMDAYPGEHYPVEVDVFTGAYDVETGETGPITGVERHLRCGCNAALDNDWPHA